MLGFRAKLNSDPELVKLLSTRFIPVAVDHEIERRKDAEGELYRKVGGQGRLEQRVRFRPERQALFQRLGGEIYQKYNPALLAVLKDYQPAKADAKSVPAGADRDEHFYPVPADAVVVHVTARMVKRGQRLARARTLGPRQHVDSQRRGGVPGQGPIARQPQERASPAAT